MDVWLQNNAGWLVPLLVPVISVILGAMSLSRADRAKKQAEAANAQATVTKTKADAAKTQTDALMGEIQAAQAGFTFVDTRLKWMEGQMQTLQTQVADGFTLNMKVQADLRVALARIQKLEQDLEDTREQLHKWQQHSHAWEHYAIAHESAMAIAPGVVQKLMNERLKQLHAQRPAPIEQAKETH